MSKNIISIKNLVKEYKKSKNTEKLIALDSLNMDIKEGSIFGLLGSNGAGKSSLINILAGTVLKNSGEVLIDGISIDEYPKKARSMIGVVPQEIYLDSFFQLYRGLEFYAGYYGVREKDRKTEKILKALNLWDKRNNYPNQLSGGMKRRFMIAKAMVHSPKILILDEPTAGVDLELRIQLWDYVRELNKQNVTIIITTHYLAEAQELCNEIAFINKGKIVKQSLKQNLLDELGSRHVDVEFKENINYKNYNPDLVTILDVNKIRFKIDPVHGNYSQILQEIAKINIGIKDLKVSEPDLEDIFYLIMNK